ncbi:hypothetical protein [Brevundimonas sp. UBA2416]|uniref:hypothetical protein n=1 Tax=Brevundimonas sp. UBA2416 TaxID=1946124 RepID=UPI0025C2EDD9|nr:hypothetical protein [Brevundimonas sp. UBA2416]HRJ62946.1 hypothetical protein [Brevundimonas sp.]
MIRILTLSGLMLASVVIGGCNTVFAPITPEVTSPIDRLDRAERNRQRPPETHPECYVARGDTSRQEQERMREACRRMERDR